MSDVNPDYEYGQIVDNLDTLYEDVKKHLPEGTRYLILKKDTTYAWYTNSKIMNKEPYTRTDCEIIETSYV